MATMERDLGILALLIVLGVLWSLYSLLTRRGKRRQERETARRQAEAQARLAAEQAPLAGLAAYAAAHGWSALGTDPHLDETTESYVHRMIRHLWHVEEPTGTTVAPVRATTYADVVTGGTAPYTWVAANAWIPIDSGEALISRTHALTAGVCVVQLGEALPPLFVSPRHARPFMTMFLKEVSLESEDFDRRFRVLALDRKYAMDVMNPRAMELVMSRDHWAFFLEMSKVVCVSKGASNTPEDVAGLVDAVSRFVGLIPSFVSDDKSLKLPALPDGTPFDPMDPAARQRLEEAFEAMTPEQQQAAAASMQVEGARFLAGMFGHDLSPEQADEVVRRAQEREERHKH
ncbi:MAG TPA: hypothetical protein VMI11_07345 [Actinomycetes bacterium]|nr:hypothetical protein [Actinomycetes bacterium]